MLSGSLRPFFFRLDLRTQLSESPIEIPGEFRGDFDLLVGIGARAQRRERFGRRERPADARPATLIVLRLRIRTFLSETA
jgi:hypothetical protein